jgi:antitoxin ParD1/3/4
MAAVTVALNDDLQRFVEEQAKNGDFESVGEYIRFLILAEGLRQARDKLEALALEGLNSGEPIPATPEYWSEKERRLMERHAKECRT